MLVGVLIAVVAACGGDATERTSPSSTMTPATTTTREPASTTTSTSVVTSTSTTTTTPPIEPVELRPGDQGDRVVHLQARLAELGYWLGPADGVFGDATLHAVVALQKAAGLARDGVVGAATSQALDAGVRPVARSAAGTVVEIDLARQLLLVVRDGVVVEVFDTSTGRVSGTTPRGRWAVTRQIDGFRRSPMGLLYRPKYFHEGVAIHGYTSVPAYPASHGCVRVTYAAIDHIWSTGLVPVGTPVWVD